MYSPFSLPPHPSAQMAAQSVIARVHAYMEAHPESELHKQGKMFGVLVYQSHQASEDSHQPEFIAAFSAKLDGSYHHEGFVPPVYEMDEAPIGRSREESRRLQQILFANYTFLNYHGETKNLLEIFADVRPILSPEEYFDHTSQSSSPLPPAGAGECCAPKLLQYAFAHQLEPISMAEFWVGAPSHTEIRHEGVFYEPCSGKCVPILRHVLRGMPITEPKETEEALRFCQEIDIIYEDSCLMVINKPSGLLSVPGKSEMPSVENYLSHQGSFPYLRAVHRLDQDTSGILVLAKDPESYKTLQAYFQRRDILKRYEAVVMPDHHSILAERPSGMIDLPLLPNPFDRPRQMVDRAHGKAALTRYEVRERLADGSYFVDFYPLTGRTHQLRVHAAHPDGLNAPIVGDRLYGSPGLSPRLMLHAAEIRFVHPQTQKEMHFCIPFSPHGTKKAST